MATDSEQFAVSGFWSCKDALDLIDTYDGQNMSVGRFEGISKTVEAFVRPVERVGFAKLLVLEKITGAAKDVLGEEEYYGVDRIMNVLKSEFLPAILVSEFELCFIRQAEYERAVDYGMRVKRLVNDIIYSIRSMESDLNDDGKFFCINVTREKGLINFIAGLKVEFKNRVIERYPGTLENAIDYANTEEKRYELILHRRKTSTRLCDCLWKN